MSFPGVRVEVIDGNLLANINVPDAVPALLVNAASYGAGSNPRTLYELPADELYPCVGDFYAEVGGRTPLVVAPIVMAERSVEDVVLQVREFLEDYPRVNLIAIDYRGEDVDFGYTKYGGLADECVELVMKLQSMLEGRAEAGYPVRAIVNAMLKVDTEVEYVPRDAGCNRVALLVGSSTDTWSGVGIALGRATKVAAHVKLGDGTVGPLAVTDIDVWGNTYDEIGTGQMEALHDAGFLVFMRRQGLEGWYFGVDNMCDQGDYGTLARGRVIDKAHRIAIAAYMRYVETPIDMADDGTIDAAAAESLAAVVESQLRAQMGDQVSNIEVVVPLEQDLVNSNTLQVIVRVLPLGYSTWISVQLGFASRLVE